MERWNERLMGWYSVEKRDLPWRKEKNPYHIWLSEIILQQTRVAQGLPYFKRFIKNYPTVGDLANASEQEILKDWQGLGYYSRARNLQKAATQVMSEWGGVFPSRYQDLIRLKGVGPYTAAAIASIAFNEPVSVVDGNVYRVLSRVYGIREPIDQHHGQKEFKALADRLLDQIDPGEYNQALMEFGALQCVPVSPDCSACTFQADCLAHKRQEVELLPIKVSKVKVRSRHFNYVIFKAVDGIYMRLRPAGDIWQGLYDFPNFEAEGFLAEQEIVAEIQQKFHLSPQDFAIQDVSEPFLHLLTHQRIHAKFWLVQIFHNLHLKDINFVPSSTMDKIPLPRLIETVLKQNEGWLD